MDTIGAMCKPTHMDAMDRLDGACHILRDGDALVSNPMAAAMLIATMVVVVVVVVVVCVCVCVWLRSVCCTVF